ncbi:MAG: transcriptional regulator, TetR family [Rhizobium sp.]|nr:transcriptional regulator, TetR family [Rhizobium sp.]
MSTAHHRPKDPEQVRRNLLDCAARLAAEEGLASLSIQAVATAANVTKGGLFHHFPSKQALVEAVFLDLLHLLDRDIDALIATDTQAYGCFTRAYVTAAFRGDMAEQSSLWAALSISALTDPGLRSQWANWFIARLRRHQETDCAPHLEIVRYAADGVWLADVMNMNQSDRAVLRARLINATRKEVAL